MEKNKKILIHINEKEKLDIDFFSRLIFLESLFYSQNLILAQIIEIIEMLGTAIEYYDI